MTAPDLDDAVARLRRDIAGSRTRRGFIDPDDVRAVLDELDRTRASLNAANTNEINYSIRIVRARTFLLDGLDRDSSTVRRAVALLDGKPAQ